MGIQQRATNAARILATRATILVGLVAGLSSESWAATITVNSLADDVFSDSVGVGTYTVGGRDTISFTANQATMGVAGGLDVRNIDGPTTLREVAITGHGSRRLKHQQQPNQSASLRGGDGAQSEQQHGDAVRRGSTRGPASHKPTTW